MHIARNKNKTKKRKSIYNSVLLRESYRKDGKVLKRTIANLSHCSPAEIDAIELALKHKDNLSDLTSLSSVSLTQGPSVGAIWLAYQVAKSLGLEKVLGNSFSGKLALLQVCARTIDQGSRLSAIRMAQSHAACDVLGISRGFDENDLYDNLDWLANNQKKIEKSLFKFHHGKEKSGLFLYDVTSSYLEGLCNELGARGYNRDKKKGKLQIVIGLLCDDKGMPVAVEVFEGNTTDSKTVAAQVQKLAEQFGCTDVTLVGDRGMLKSTQIKSLPENFHYITAITKPQIKKLMEKDILQLSLFDNEVGEVIDGDVRYVFRRNPMRAEEINQNRTSKENYIKRFIQAKNEYLQNHPKAEFKVAKRDSIKKLEQLNLQKWCKIRKVKGLRRLELLIDSKLRKEDSLLDGCYVIKTDVLTEKAENIHARYKDLAQVEKAFRYCKTSLLEVRPIFVRTEAHTRGHVFVVMLSYLILQRLQEAWQNIDLTVEEGLKKLAMLSAVKLSFHGKADCLKIPKPDKQSKILLDALQVSLPSILAHKKVNVVTRKKLPLRRKST